MSHSPLVSVPGHEIFVFTDFNFDACNRHYNTRAKNLIPSSEDMSDNFFWEYLNSATSIKNYARAPNGTFTSNLIQDPSVGSVSFIKETISIENDVEDYVFSVYIRNGTGVDSQFSMSFENGTSVSADLFFDWTTNKLSSTGNIADNFGYEYICDGWYRIWCLKRNNGLGNTQVSLYFYPSLTTNEADCEMWGVQLEKAVQTPGHYIKTTGAAKTDGCFPKGENLLTYSEQFDNAAWTKGNATVTANTFRSPDNEYTADTLVRVSGDHFIYNVYPITTHANKTFTGGVWLRKGNYSDTVNVTIRDNTSSTIISTTSHVLVTRWVLVTVTATFGVSPGADIRLEINPQDNIGSAGDTLHMWGASLAEGSVYKAYQKTEATALINGTGGLDNALKCYESYETCQSRNDYGSVCKVVRVCQRGAQIPKWEGIHQGPPMYPFLKLAKNNPSFTSTRINPGKGLSQRGAVNAQYQDGIHHDRGIDPYWSERTHDTSQGTFFGKLLSRFRHYHKRRYDVYTGYLDDGVFDIANFEKRSYLLDVIRGPDLNSTVNVIAKDQLFITDSSLKIPEANSGVLIADQLAADLQFDILLNQGAQYPRTGTIKIGSELINYDYCGHNMLTRSEEFDHADWLKSGMSAITFSTATNNPFGVLGAYIVPENTSTSQHQIFQDVIGTLFDENYTVSIYIKTHPSGSGYVYLALELSSNVFFDIANGNLLSSEDSDDYINAAIEDVGDGWYRLSVTFLGVSGANASFAISSSSTGSNTNYTGTGNDQFYLWAASVNDGLTLGNYYKTVTAQLITNDRIIVPNVASRGVYNTIAEDHSIDDSVQQCLVYNDNVVDILYDVFAVQGKVDLTYIPYNNDETNRLQWDDEKFDWLSAHTFFGIIAEPTQINKIIKELTIAAMCNIWADEIEDKIVLKAIVPPRLNAPVKMLDENSSILKDSFKYTRREDMRRSRVMVIYDMLNQVEGDDPENFNKIYIQADPFTEEFYGGSPKVEKIRSRWLSKQNTGQAAQLAGRTLARFIDAPKEATWRVHAKDEDLKTGDLVEVETPGMQDFYGAREVITFEILEKRELEVAEVYEMRGLESRFTGSYGFIGPNTLGEFSAESTDNKRKYAFICYNTGEFLDGSPAYKII